MTITLREELFLLAHDRSGRTRVPNFVLEAGLASAALMELRHLGLLEVTGDGDVAVRRTSPSGDPLLDRLLHQLTSGPARLPHELLPACGGDVKQSVTAGLVAHGQCRLDPAGHVVAVDQAGRRDAARNAIRSGEASDLGALVWATELSGYVLGPVALVTRLRLGRQSAADPLALAVRQAFPLPSGAFRINGSPGAN
ncbi:MAG TPA: GPP34 family phosphoprotein [Actinoplanes sp.]|nr:GPP34 family phosphoprotein [Actinoplanes sp.]